MTTASIDRSLPAADDARADSYEDWLNRTVDAMPPLSDQQQRELRQLLR